MRLGEYACEVTKNTKAYRSYKNNSIKERHRHRYEFNNNYLDKINNSGLIVSGLNKKLNLVEMIELTDHPWFVGVQFHPELKSRIMKTHPLFNSFVKSAISHSSEAL